MIYSLKGTKLYRDYQLLKHISYPELRFLDTSDNVGEHPLDGAGGERRVVLRHVLGEPVQPDGLVNDGVCEPFVVN